MNAPVGRMPEDTEQWALLRGGIGNSGALNLINSTAG